MARLVIPEYTAQEIIGALAKKLVWSGSKELVIPNFYAPGWWECDLLAVTRAGYTSEYEIKISRADFKVDSKKMTRSYRGSDKYKHQALSRLDEPSPNYFWYVMPIDLVPLPDIPEWAGVMWARWQSTRIRILTVRQAPRLWKTKPDQQKLRNKMLKSFYHRYWQLYWGHLPKEGVDV